MEKQHQQNEENQFRLPQRYVYHKILGKGAYGVVGKFFDSKQNQFVAIKKIKLCVNMNKKSREIISETKKVLRELKILRNFKHACLISLKHALVEVQGNECFIYMILPLMDADLYTVILKSKLEDAHIQYIMYQIFLGLHYLHSGNVIHRDIKPNNILATQDCEIVLCDFGFARDFEGLETDMTEYVVARHFRAPEIILCPKHYSMKVDIWAVGVTFYELITKKTLFNARGYEELVLMIIRTLGTPLEDDLNFISNEGAKTFLRKLPFHPPRTVSMNIKNYSNPKALDLLDRCLIFNPNKRISALEALKHPYFETYFHEEDLIFDVPNIDFSFINEAHDDKRILIDLIMKELKLINSEAGEEYYIPRFNEFNELV